jgi:hypothetical protein
MQVCKGREVADMTTSLTCKSDLGAAYFLYVLLSVQMCLLIYSHHVVLLPRSVVACDTLLVFRALAKLHREAADACVIVSKCA